MNDEETIGHLQAEVTRAKELLQLLAQDCPVTFSTEGLDDRCFWCAGDIVYVRRDPRNSAGHRGARHNHDCPWVLTRQFLGLPLGDENPVVPE